MLKTIFREYDIRGIYPTQLNEQVVKTIGYLLGLKMKQRACKNVSVGYDARLSNKTLFAYLSSGLNKAGIKVYHLGLVPTPLGYFSMYEGMKFDANIMITGSHNPKEYNGFKISINKESFFGKELLAFADEVLENLNLDIQDDTSCEDYDILSVYVDFMLKQFKHLKNLDLKFAIDCANGASFVVLKPLIEALNLKAKVLFAEPDGNFPNHEPDPTESKNLKPLQELLLKDKDMQIAFAFDGDADRIVVVGKNRAFHGDELCYVFASAIEKPRILADIRSSKNLFDEVSKFGTILMSKAGHSNIKKKMKEENIDLAAEVSGHIFFKHRYFGFDDGIYAFLRALELLQQGKDISAMIEALPKLYTLDEIKIKSDDNLKFELIEKFKTTIKNGALDEVKSLCEIDGLRIDFGYGWALFRASNTSPYVVTRFEADSKERVEEIKNKTMKIFEDIMK